MTNKTIMSAVMAIALASSLCAGNQNTNKQYSSDEKNAIYSGGVKDAVMVTSQVFSDSKAFESNTKYLKGYIVYKDATRLNSVEIIKYSAIATKLGYKVDFFNIKGKDCILFSTKDRKPDATAIAKKLKYHKIATNIAQINQEVKKVTLVGSDSIKNTKEYFRSKHKREATKIRDLEKYIAELEGKNKDYRVLKNPSNKILECKDNSNVKFSKRTRAKRVVKMVTLDLSNLQVVNRVLTERYLKANKIRNPKKAKPLNNYTAKKMSIEIVEKKNAIVAKNIKKTYKKKIPTLNSFDAIYKYITNNAVLTKNGSLVMHGQVFNVGDVISAKWVLKNVIYSNGVVIVKKKNSDYHIVTKR
jgi:hypothetical protein